MCEALEHASVAALDAIMEQRSGAEPKACAKAS